MSTTLSPEVRAAILQAAADIDDRAGYDSGYQNPSDGDLAWKRGMHHAAEMLRDQANGTRRSRGMMSQGIARSP